jgi:hypothetical protein
MVTPMYAPRGKQRAEDGVRSEWRCGMERIALQDVGYSERKQTYTYGLPLRRTGELSEHGRSVYQKGDAKTKNRNIFTDRKHGWKEIFINKAQTRSAKAQVAEETKRCNNRKTKATKAGESSKDAHLGEA